jgi:hypothetical protein
MGSNGFQVDLDALEAFQQGLGNLIAEHFASSSAANHACLAQNTYVAASDFGEFPEAQSLASRYSQVRDNITSLYKTVSDQVQQMQQVAKQTKQNYQDSDEQAKQHVTNVKQDSSGSSSGSSQTSSSSAYGNV